MQGSVFLWPRLTGAPKEEGEALELFQAPHNESSDYVGGGACALCAREVAHRFHLTGAVDIIVECSSCSALIDLSAQNRSNDVCFECGDAMRVPDLGRDAAACVVCIVDGRVAFWHDTPIGCVRWRNPFNQDDDRPTKPAAPVSPIHLPNGVTMTVTSKRTELSDEDFFRAGRGSAALRQLMRTPRISTWQEPRWLFCCNTPMAYRGEWGMQRFDEESEDGKGRALFDRIVDRFDVYGTSDSAHVFCCQVCAGHRGYWDGT